MFISALIQTPSHNSINRRQQSEVNLHTEQPWFKAFLQCAWLQNECGGKTAVSRVWFKQPTIGKVLAYFQVIFRFFCGRADIVSMLPGLSSGHLKGCMI